MKIIYVRLESSNLNGGSYWDKIPGLLLYKGGLVRGASLEEFQNSINSSLKVDR